MPKKMFVSKTIAERTDYNKSIKRISSDSTIQPSEDDQQSTNLNETGSLEDVGKRPLSTADNVKYYFSKHWVELLVSLFIIILSFFMVEAKIKLAVIDNTLESQQIYFNKVEDNLDIKINDNNLEIENIKSKIIKIDETNNNQNIIMNEITIKLEFLQKMFDSNK